jgi:hypothetical protein
VRTKNLAATEIATKFVDAVNDHDVEGLTKLMSSVLGDVLAALLTQSLRNRFIGTRNSFRGKSERSTISISRSECGTVS